MELGEYLDNCRLRKFNWQDWNCVHFVSGWVLQRTGIDMLRLYATPTDSALSALRLTRSFGTLDAAVSQALGRASSPPLSARVGDVAFFDNTGVAGMLGICNGVSAVCVAEDGGFLPTPMKNASCVWNIT